MGFSNKLSSAVKMGGGEFYLLITRSHSYTLNNLCCIVYCEHSKHCVLIVCQRIVLEKLLHYLKILHFVITYYTTDQHHY